MRKIIIGLVATMAIFMVGCANPMMSDSSGDTSGDTGGDTGAGGSTSELVIDGTNVYRVVSYDVGTSSLSARSISASENVVAASEIPGVGTVVETDAGNYYLEGATEFEEITLPSGTTDLHINQFGRYTVDGTEYIYYGAGNNLYREAVVNFDTNLNGEVVVEGQIFTDTHNILTTLQYIVDESSGNVRYSTRGIVPADKNGVWMTSIALEWESNGTAKVTDDSYLNIGTELMYKQDGDPNTTNDDSPSPDVAKLSSLHVAYISIDADGTIRHLHHGVEVTYSNSESVTTSVDDAFGVMYVSPTEHVNNGVFVHNRIDRDNPNTWTDTFGFNRDTMFRSYWDTQVYFQYHTQREYIVLNADGTDVQVSVYATVGNDVQQVGTTFSVPFELIDGYTLIPNMWVDTDETVWMIHGSVLRHYDAHGNELIADSYSHTQRLDVVTVLPDGDVIVMDANGDWYNTDGSTYTGQNIVARY